MYYNESPTQDALTQEVTGSNSFNDYYELLNRAASQWNMDPSQIEEHMNKIAFHESKYGTDKYAPIQISDKTESGYGPGRGMFQFETGAGQAGETAAIRLKRILGETPSWLNITEKGFDASQLSEEQQKMLFLANYMGKENPEGYGPDNPHLMSSGLSGVTSENLPEWWAQHHWAGLEDEKAEKIRRFSSDMNMYGI
jgi:hypothetical protein